MREIKSRTAHLNILKYCLKHSNKKIIDIINAYDAREQHTNYIRAKDEMGESGQLIEEDDGRLRLNFSGDFELLKEPDIRFALLFSGTLDMIFTERARLKTMTFPEAWEVMARMQKAIPMDLAQKMIKNPRFRSIIKKKFSG